MTAREVLDALRARHPEAGGQWTFIEEAWGIDAFAMAAWMRPQLQGARGVGSVPYARVSYEVKVSRQDFRKELVGYEPGPDARRSRRSHPWPIKAQRALDMSHYFFFATPKGLLKDHERLKGGTWDLPHVLEKYERGEAERPYLWLPEGVGLVEVDGRGCFAVQPAAKREIAEPWREHTVAELLRYKHNGPDVRAVRANLVSSQSVVEYQRRDIERAEALLAQIAPAVLEPGSKWHGSPYQGAREETYTVVGCEDGEVLCEYLERWSRRPFSRTFPLGRFLLRFVEQPDAEVAADGHDTIPVPAKE